MFGIVVKDIPPLAINGVCQLVPRYRQKMEVRSLDSDIFYLCDFMIERV